MDDSLDVYLDSKPTDDGVGVTDPIDNPNNNNTQIPSSFTEEEFNKKIEERVKEIETKYERFKTYYELEDKGIDPNPIIAIDKEKEVFAKTDITDDDYLKYLKDKNPSLDDEDLTALLERHMNNNYDAKKAKVKEDRLLEFDKKKQTYEAQLLAQKQEQEAKKQEEIKKAEDFLRENIAGTTNLFGIDLTADYTNELVNDILQKDIIGQHLTKNPKTYIMLGHLIKKGFFDNPDILMDYYKGKTLDLIKNDDSNTKGNGGSDTFSLDPW